MAQRSVDDQRIPSERIALSIAVIKEIDRRWLIDRAPIRVVTGAGDASEAALRTVELPSAPGCKCLLWGMGRRCREQE